MAACALVANRAEAPSAPKEEENFMLRVYSCVYKVLKDDLSIQAPGSGAIRRSM